jgi:hypothetical protein
VYKNCRNCHKIGGEKGTRLPIIGGEKGSRLPKIAGYNGTRVPNISNKLAVASLSQGILILTLKSLRKKMQYENRTIRQ